MSPGTAGTWVNAVGEAVLPLINLMNEDLLDAPFVQMDETYLQVLQEREGAELGSLHGGARRRPARQANHPLQLRALAHRRGAEESADRIRRDRIRGKLLTDGLELYDIVAEALG